MREGRWRYGDSYGDRNEDGGIGPMCWVSSAMRRIEVEVCLIVRPEKGVELLNAFLSRGRPVPRSIFLARGRAFRRFHSAHIALKREEFMAARLVQLAGTRAGGFILTRHEAAEKGEWRRYSLVWTAAKA
jgi:hypothetical protein